MLNKIILIVHEGETVQHAGCAEDAGCEYLMPKHDLLSTADTSA
jgi:hypothetical protein